MADNIVFNKEAKEYIPKKKKEEETANTTNSIQPQTNPSNSKQQQEQEVSQSLEQVSLFDTEKEQKEPKDIKFNLNAKEYVPKKEPDYSGFQVEGLDDEEEESEDEIIDELVNQELNDPIDPFSPDFDEEESDDEKWFPKYKDCTCCTGYIYKCSGDVCSSLGVCFCKAQEDYDPEVN